MHISIQLAKIGGFAAIFARSGSQVEKRFALSMPTFVGCHYFSTYCTLGWLDDWRGQEKVSNELSYFVWQYTFYEIFFKISPWPCWCWGPPWGWGWTRTPAPRSGSKIPTHHVGQQEKPKGVDVKKSTKRPNWPWWDLDPRAFLFRYLLDGSKVILFPIEKESCEPWNW